MARCSAACAASRASCSTPQPAPSIARADRRPGVASSRARTGRRRATGAWRCCRPSTAAAWRCRPGCPTLPSPPRMPFDQRHLPAARAQPLAGGGAGQAGADDDGAPLGRRRARRERLAGGEARGSRAAVVDRTRSPAGRAAPPSAPASGRARAARASRASSRASARAKPAAGVATGRQTAVDARRKLRQRRLQRRVQQVERDAAVGLRACGESRAARRRPARSGAGARAAAGRRARLAPARRTRAPPSHCASKMTSARARASARRQSMRSARARRKQATVVIVDHADALHVGIDDGRADELEAALGQVLREAVGQLGLRGRAPSASD